MNDHKTIVCDTTKTVSLFRLISIKMQLKLENLGIKSSGGALRPRLAKEFGLKPRDGHDVFIAAVQKQIDAIHAQEDAKHAARSNAVNAK